MIDTNKIDEILEGGGFREGELSILMAGSNVGKTLLHLVHPCTKCGTNQVYITGSTSQKCRHCYNVEPLLEEKEEC